MFTLPAGTLPDKDNVADLIAYNELKRPRYNSLENYYLGIHEILNRAKPETLANNKVVTNHCRYITDVNVGYLLGNPVEYQADDDLNIDLILDEYKKQTIDNLNHEIARDVSIFGRQYELEYLSGNDVKSKDIDVRNCAIAYDDTVEHNKLFAVIYEPHAKQKNKFEDIMVFDANYIYDFTNSTGAIELQDKGTKTHDFQKVPVIEYINNPEKLGDFEHVLTLVDAYNTLTSDRVNDKEQWVDAILCLYGIDLDDDMMQGIQNDRILSNLPEGTKAEYVTKAFNEADADTLRRVIEADIHKISMTPNMSDENFVGNSSGVAIRYKLLAFEQSVSNKERYFEKGLMERFELYNNYLSKLKSMPIVPIYKVDAIFKRNLPQNDLETSQMIANLTSQVDKETLVGQLSFIKNAKETIAAKAKEDQAAADVQAEQFGTNVDAAGNQIGTATDQKQVSNLDKLNKLLTNG